MSTTFSSTSLYISSSQSSFSPNFSYTTSGIFGVSSWSCSAVAGVYLVPLQEQRAIQGHRNPSDRRSTSRADTAEIRRPVSVVDGVSTKWSSGTRRQTSNHQAEKVSAPNPRASPIYHRLLGLDCIVIHMTHHRGRAAGSLYRRLAPGNATGRVGDPRLAKCVIGSQEVADMAVAEQQ